MILEDFMDFFVNADISTRQEIVSSLLAMSTESSSLIELKEYKVVIYPYCQGVRICANGKLKGVQRYLYNGWGKNFSETTGKFWYNIKKKDKITHYFFA